jgi:hypothetical protein
MAGTPEEEAAKEAARIVAQHAREKAAADAAKKKRP